MFKNFNNRLNSLDYSISIQFTAVTYSLVSNFKNAITPQNIAENCNNAIFNAL